MSNNINNLNGGFNAVNFNGKRSKEAEVPAAEVCDCPDCKEEAMANASEALAAMGEAQVKRPYKYNPENTRNDIQEFTDTWDSIMTESLIKDFRDSYARELVERGYDEIAADEAADRAAMCLYSHRNV